jgi:hypothetical protein
MFTVCLFPVNSTLAFSLKDLTKPIDGLYKVQKEVIRDAQKAIEKAPTEADTKREALNGLRAADNKYDELAQKSNEIAIAKEQLENDKQQLEREKAQIQKEKESINEENKVMREERQTMLKERSVAIHEREQLLKEKNALSGKNTLFAGGTITFLLTNAFTLTGLFLKQKEIKQKDIEIAHKEAELKEAIHKTSSQVSVGQHVSSGDSQGQGI